MKTAAEFWAKVDRRAGPAGCWPWLGARTRDGHGCVKWAGRTTGAHRVAVALNSGQPLLPQIVHRHTCHNPACCNPAHIRAGTHSDNVADRVAAGRSACGEHNGRAKLTPAAVTALRRFYRRGLATQRELATLFQVSPRAVRFIITGQHWPTV